MSNKQVTHTPGPWELSLNVHDEDHGEQEYLHIIAKKRMSDIGMIRLARHKPNRTTDQANARLIAAAPELFEQCKLFEKLLSTLIMEGHSGADLERDNLQAILDKVEGETAT